MKNKDFKFQTEKKCNGNYVIVLLVISGFHVCP